MKKFYLTNDGLISKHKIRDTKIVGFGIIHEDQFIVAYLSDGSKVHFSYPDIKVGGHVAKPIINLNNKEINKVDIVTIPKTEFSRAF